MLFIDWTHFFFFSCTLNSHDGSVLAVSSSYTFEEGSKDYPPEDNVFLRRIGDLESKPRLKA